MIWELARAGLLALSLRAQVLLGLLLLAVWWAVYRSLLSRRGVFQKIKL